MVTKKETAKAPAQRAAAAPKAKKARPAKSAGAAVLVAPPNHRTAVGVVVSNKMQKTIVIEVTRRVKHGMYLKFVEKSRRFKAHDEKNDAKIGDRVEVVESRPLSRDKRWVLRSIIRRAGQAPEVNA